MLIYRIEHEAYGHGPYVLNYRAHEHECEFMGEACLLCDSLDDLIEFADNLCCAHANSTHPTPNNIPYWKICGFESMEALRAWFEGYEYDLDFHGYVIVTYTYAETVTADDYGQVTFEKDAAKRLTMERI